MIFFLTTLNPAPQVTGEIKKYKSLLFRSKILIPLPLTVIALSLSRDLPVRPERKKIADLYPDQLTPSTLRKVNSSLILSFREELTFHSDFDESFDSFFFPGSLYLGDLKTEGTTAESEFPHRDFSSITKYSLGCYRISTSTPDDWWFNMSWEKMWEVKRSVTKKPSIS
ncbi:MAG: hypothetical protein JXR86_06065 [Spirochaetales bacterium]|nr:hypothetical protein [Spirochaetales bacterium]